MCDKIEKLKRALELQKKPGTWNYSPYMHGMANGLIYAVSVLENTEPEFLATPTEWLKDTENNK